MVVGQFSWMSPLLQMPPKALSISTGPPLRMTPSEAQMAKLSDVLASL